jgi:hypothetical protein
MVILSFGPNECSPSRMSWTSKTASEPVFGAWSSIEKEASPEGHVGRSRKSLWSPGPFE